MMYRGNTAPQNFSQNSPKILHYLGTIYLLSITCMATVDDKNLKILIKAAHAGGKVLRRYFGQALDIIEKSSVADFQTKADLESEKSILKILKTEFPEYNILSEEEGET